jgi:DNA-binding MarR family transcriptional regulator
MSKEDQIQSIVENLARLQRPSLRSGWKQIGLSHAQIGMLFLLSYHKQSSVNQAAEFLGVSKSAVTQLASPLEEKGLINRQNDTSDRRIVRLSLTGKGGSVIKKLARHKFDGVRSALDGLSQKDVQILYEIHSKIAAKTKIKE